MEVEKKSSSVASTIQVEVAETMETFRMDSTQWWDNHESKTTLTGSQALTHIMWSFMISPVAVALYLLTPPRIILDTWQYGIGNNRELGAGSNPLLTFFFNNNFM